MDSQLVQRTRYQLQVRVRTAKTCPTPLFPAAVRHLLAWIDHHPLLGHLTEPLRGEIQRRNADIEAMFATIGTPAMKEISWPWEPSNREDACALAFAALRVVATSDFSEHADSNTMYLAAVAVGYNGTQRVDLGEITEAFRDVSVQSVFEYLDEQIDARNSVLGILLKYKTRCEWYRRDRLRASAEAGVEGRRGERALVFDLYEYLHDQGVDFAIESATASGEPDLIATDAGGQLLVADAKYVTDDAKLAETMAAGFRQVVQYCRDKNEPVGYLVVFLNCGVAPEVDGDRDDGFPCFRHAATTVYYVVVDIRERTETASKLRKPRVVAIDRARLVTMIEPPEQTTETSPA